MSRLALVVAVALCAACGTNRPDIPDDLKQTAGGTTGSYPAGPYGGEKGDTIDNFSFSAGWLNPEASNYDPAAFAPIAFADFHDPDGSKGHKLLLLNTSAVWCGACKAEHGGSPSKPSLNEHQDSLGPKGLTIISLLFQDAKSDPATADHLVGWTQTYETRHPMALDPDYQMGQFGSAESAPLNIVVEARTMTVVEKFIGDQASVMWPFIESELAKR
ncbi:MAG TPA: hypothetical protein PKD61_02830 [Polyangiaceae bacterium]|nr:hypothetical protein [Polyangiaceae bacterium]